MTQLSGPAARLGASRAAIRAHYDVGNSFYSAWLDKHLIYSAARWPNVQHQATTLLEAQVRKLDWHLDATGLKEQDRLLDVGCGWGALLNHSATQRNLAAAVGLTPSHEQVAWIKQHMDNPAIRAVQSNWQETQFTTPFDAIISIGALEHFARPDISLTQKIGIYERFFDFCKQNLTESGRVSLQFIGWMDVDPGDEVRHLPTELFPESNLPRLYQVLAAADRHFSATYVENRPDDYIRTLHVWLARLQARRDDLARAYGSVRVRSYIRGFQRFTLGFERGSLGLYRLALARNKNRAEFR